MKIFKINYLIGEVKYAISFHDGVKKHKDGSSFFDIKIFKNKVKLNKCIKKMKEEGYKEV